MPSRVFAEKIDDGVFLFVLFRFFFFFFFLDALNIILISPFRARLETRQFNDRRSYPMQSLSGNKETPFQTKQMPTQNH